MRLSINFFIVLLICLRFISYGQDYDWYSYNDSTFQKTISSYSEYCTPLNSSKKVGKRQLKLDKKLIEIANQLYRISTFDELEKIQKKVKKFSTNNTFKDSVMPIYFYPYSDGNLRITFQAEEINHFIIRKRITIGTNTKTGCKEKNECCLSYFDFIYIYDYLLKDIKFPMPLKPYTTDLIVERLY